MTRPDPIRPLAVRAEEAAAMLGIGKRTLWAMTNRGEIPVVRCGASGRSVRYRVADLEEWLERRLDDGRGRELLR